MTRCCVRLSILDTTTKFQLVRPVLEFLVTSTHGPDYVTRRDLISVKDFNKSHARIIRTISSNCFAICNIYDLNAKCVVRLYFREAGFNLKIENMLYRDKRSQSITRKPLKTSTSITDAYTVPCKRNPSLFILLNRF